MNIIEQLQNINVDDLKKININQIKDSIQSRPDISINILLIGLTLFATVQIYSWHQNKLRSFTSDIKTMEEKIQIITEQKAAQGKYDDFIKKFPEYIPRDQLSNKLSDFALANKVQILSFSPMETKGNNYFELMSYRLIVSSNNYDNIISFMKNIEDSSQSIRVSKWSGKLTADYARPKDDEEETASPLEINTELEVINLKK